MEPRLSELEVERTGKGGSEKRSAAIEEANVKGKDKQLTAASNQRIVTRTGQK